MLFFLQWFCGVVMSSGRAEKTLLEALLLDLGVGLLLLGLVFVLFCAPPSTFSSETRLLQDLKFVGAGIGFELAGLGFMILYILVKK